MVLKTIKQTYAFLGAALIAGVIFVQCTVDSIHRPEPRIDFFYGGSTPSSDTISIVNATTVIVTVNLYAVGGLKSSTVGGDAAESSEKYSGKDARACDTISVLLDLSGSEAVNKTITVSVTDWQDQTTDRTLVFAYTPGGVQVTKPFVYHVQSAFASVGGTATFTATAIGGNLTYQWQKDSVDIALGTSNSYTTPAVTAKDNGTTYRCIVRNSAGSDTSNLATLTVDIVTAPVITADPLDDTVGVGEYATFSVSASGSTPSYTWQKNGVTISGAKDPSYTTPAAVLGDDGTEYRCIVSNGAGIDTSAAATLTVGVISPTVTSDPQNAAVSVGQSASFYVYATGTTLAYQWQKNGSDVSGANSYMYVTPEAVNGDNGASYRCIVSNEAGSDTSNAATLTVAILEIPVVTSNPEDVTVTAPRSATFMVSATGTSPSYQWQKNGVSISGAQYYSYTTPSTVIGDSGATFRCIVGNGAGADTSAAAILIVNRPPAAIIGQSFEGGIVFYVDGTGQHGLIAAASDQSSSAEWGGDGTSIGGTTALVGAGQANTTLIVDGCVTAGIAARICDELSLGGYSDWYLPSKNELQLLYAQKSTVGSFSNATYWSSTENNATTAALQFFNGGYQLNASKSTTAYVRAIRAF